MSEEQSMERHYRKKLEALEKRALALVWLAFGQLVSETGEEANFAATSLLKAAGEVANCLLDPEELERALAELQ